MERQLSAEPIPKRWLIGFAATALGLRLAYAVVHPLRRSLYSDMLGTYELARSLANPTHAPTALDVLKPKGLAVVAAFLFAGFGRGMLPVLGVLQALLGAATVPLLALGARPFVGTRPAMIAAALLAVDFLAIGYGGFLLSETYLMFFFSLAFACLDPTRPSRCLVAGVALGVGTFFKEQALPLALVWAAILLFWHSPRDLAQARGGSLRGYLASTPRIAAAMLLLGVLAIKIPETLSISRVLGHGAAFPPYGGQMFFLGHCDVGALTMQGSDGLRFVSLSTKAPQLDEPWPTINSNISVLDASYYYREGWKCLSASVPHALAWTGRQLFDALAGPPWATLTPWPLVNNEKVLACFWNCVFAYVFVPLALWGLWKRRRDGAAWLAVGGPLAAMWGLAVLFSGNPRFREPYDLFTLCGAGIGLDALWGRRRRPFRAVELR